MQCKAANKFKYFQHLPDTDSALIQSQLFGQLESKKGFSSNKLE